jgi:hypothetical protein
MRSRGAGQVTFSLDDLVKPTVVRWVDRNATSTKERGEAADGRGIGAGGSA